MATVLSNEDAGYTEEQIAKIATATEHKEKGDAAFKAGELKAGASARALCGLATG
jgi:hypothetical protein